VLFRSQGIDTLAKVFSYDVAELIKLFQDYSYNPGQFASMKDLYSNYPQFSSIAGRQLDTRSFADLVKIIEAFPATTCACVKLSCQFRTLVRNPRHQMSDFMIVDPLMIKAKIIWPDASQIKECAEILREVQSDTGPDQMAAQSRSMWKSSLVSGIINHSKGQLCKQNSR
jgi:hypothetical protein